MMFRLLRPLKLAAVMSFMACATIPALAQETVIITTRVVYPGEVVDASALQEVPLQRQLRDITQVALDWSQVEGKVARRTLLPGRLIAVSSLRDAWLVEPGKPVQVLFVHGGLEISISGVPLQVGAAGDMVRVRNADSGAVFSGIVMADGSIRVSST
ncbi:flagellar basal body P-ring formation chaperone FlgA [Mesorhizobium sp. CAU 1741]|uniref:flagellar basal body P-ring formation chaperone FlgA n=1 Tax=Mesorhizobium sp. CAU 1741 TaxID=3140366 RepID=UPI00325BFDE1